MELSEIRKVYRFKVAGAMLIFLIQLMVMMHLGQAANYFQINTFSDGNSSFNVTQNSTKYISVPTNTSIVNASLTVTGIFHAENWSYIFREEGDSYATAGSWTDPEDINDTNYFTYGEGVGAIEAEYYVNYTSTPNITDVLWEVKHSNGPAQRQFNITLPETCINQNEYQLKVGSFGLVEIILFYCYNSTDWELIYFDNDGLNNDKIYEEAIWEIQERYPSDVVLRIDDTIVFDNVGNLTGTNTSIDINATKIEDFITSDGEVPLHIGFIDGMVEISSLDIWYEDVWVCDGRAGEQVAYNFTIIDEDNYTVNTGDISIDLEYSGNILTFQAEDVTSLAVCIGGNVSYTITGVIYSDVAYLHRYYLTDAALDSTTRTINLYNFNQTLGKSYLEYSVKDYAWTEYKNITIMMQRYYPQNHSWVTVQQYRTGEFGIGYFNIYEQEVDYRFMFYSGTTLLKATDTVNFLCDSGVCQVTSQIPLTDPIAIDINAGWAYSNDTKILNVTWNDPTGQTSEVTVQLYRQTMTGVALICNETISTAIGNYECNATGHLGSAQLIIKGNVGSPIIINNSYIDLYGDQMHYYLETQDASLWTAVIYLMIIALGLTGSAVAVVIMSLLALFVISMLTISPIITLPFLGLCTVIGVIIAYKVKN